MKHTSLFMLALTLCPLACGGAASDESTRIDNLMSGIEASKISLAEAVATAREGYPEASVWKGEFEVEEGDAVFEVVVVNGGEGIELQIDPQSGEIIETEAEDDKVPAACALDITLDEAIAIAEAEVGGDAVEFDSLAGADNAEDGEPARCEIDVTILKDGAFIEVELAADGAIVEVSDADDEDEDEDDADDVDDVDDAK